MQTLLNKVLEQGAELLASLVMLAVMLVLREIRLHVKSQRVQSALALLATSAGHVINAGAAFVASAFEAGHRPNAAALESAAMAGLKAMGSSAIATLVMSGGFTPAAIDATLATLLASAQARLGADAGVPVAVASVAGESAK